MKNRSHVTAKAVKEPFVMTDKTVKAPFVMTNKSSREPVLMTSQTAKEEYPQPKNYPISSYEISRMFLVKPQPRQLVHNISSCYFNIKKALFDMDEYGYDFHYGTNQMLKFKERQQKQIKLKFFRRKVKLRFRCDSCRKNFTSIVGTIEIRFTVQNHAKYQNNQKIRYPFLIRFKIKIYKMECQKCRKMATPMIYDSQLEAVENSFCFLIAKIVEEIPERDRDENEGRQNAYEVHNHREQLCEACKSHVCAAVPKEANQKVLARRRDLKILHDKEGEQKEVKPE